MKQGFDRAQRQPETGSGLVVGLVFHIEQHHGLAIPLRQLVEQLPDADRRRVVGFRRGQGGDGGVVAVLVVVLIQRDRRLALADLGQGAVPVCTAADLFLFKLLAWRKKDQVDVENLLWMQGVPDRSYVEDWARRLGLEDRLREAISGL